jgi:hypothetical protein
MTGMLLDPANRPAGLVAETRHKSPRWIRSGHMANVVGLCSRTLHEAMAPPWRAL